MNKNFRRVCDDYLLDLAVHVARWVYRWIGVTNFRLADSMCILSGIFLLLSIHLYPDTIPLPWICASVIMAGILFFEWVFISITERMYRLGHVNFARTDTLCVNMRTELFVIACGIMVVAIFVPFEFRAVTTSLCLSMFCADFAVYFASIEPEDRNISKLRRFLARMNRICNPGIVS